MWKHWLKHLVLLKWNPSTYLEETFCLPGTLACILHKTVLLLAPCCCALNSPGSETHLAAGHLAGAHHLRIAGQAQPGILQAAAGR